MSRPFPFKKFNDSKSIKRYCSGQKDIVKRICESKKKVIILNAPTGVGKSLIAMMTGNQMSYTTNYICTTKVLQNQLKDDFSEAFVMKGRSNYICNKFWTDVNKLMADSCASKCTDVKDGKIKCDYETAKSNMFKSRYRVLNTAYWLTEANYVGKLSGQRLIVVDEADRLDAQTTNFIGLVITKDDIRKYRLTAPRRVTKVDSWKEWGKITYNIMCGLYPGGIKANERDKSVIKGYRFKSKVDMFNSTVDESWIFEKTKFGSWVFKPIWINKELGERYIWKHADKFVLMSATPPMPSSLGLELKDVDIINVESSYPVENRWVYYNGVVDMSYKNRDRHEDIVPHVIDIIKKHEGHKGIIHTCSYKMRDMLIEKISTNRFITHDSKNKEEQMEKFLNCPQDSIFLSPSSERGVSLDGDKGRFCIWLKVPFGNLGDKQIAARTYCPPFGSEWYARDAMQTIVQGCGRVVRGHDDWGYSYILDKQFSKIKQYCPDWFMQGLVVGSGLK